MTGVKVIVQYLPSINLIRSCHTILQIIGETIMAYRIGEVEQWDQLFSDGTGRRHTALHIFFTGVISE